LPNALKPNALKYVVRLDRSPSRRNQVGRAMEALMTRSVHWEAVYATKPATSVSWFQVMPEPSIRALERLRLGPTHSLIDAGGGASSLVDLLLDAG
jgi:hypothetical protein